LEEVNKQLINELKRRRQEIKTEDCCADYGNSSYVLVLRIYAPTNPGKRSLNHQLWVISPRKDLGLDTAQIEKEARKRYNIPQ
jgi:hypothetical protein